ncbi:MAG: serine/threonine-protein kinase [Pirellula sp.]
MADDSRPDDHLRFQREAESVASLDHPNIVRVYEIGHQGNRPFLSMEYVDGGSLDTHVQSRTWSNHEIASLVKALADAMHYAHGRGIIHRDLKPANILLVDNRTPKIVDFGLAKRHDDAANFQTKTGTLLGTPCYMSPEQQLHFPIRTIDIRLTVIRIDEPAKSNSIREVVDHFLIEVVHAI